MADIGNSLTKAFDYVHGHHTSHVRQVAERPAQ
jgi:hypothetical protein